MSCWAVASFHLIASPCDENMFDLSPIRVDMSVGDDMLFDFAFEGDTWLIEAEYDSDWLAVVQPMCGSCCASCDVRVYPIGLHLVSAVRAG